MTRSGAAVVAHGQIPDDLVERTLTLWQTRADRPLTRDDVREIVTNIAGFVEVLMRWEGDKRPQEVVQDEPDFGCATAREE
jgi:hypothetical protein